MKCTQNTGLIHLDETDDFAVRRPLLIAHRGGVIGPSSPENSLRAIALAGAHGYDMVELDVVQTADGEPVLFHGWDLHIACGLDRHIEDMTAEEVELVRYRASDQHIATLEAAAEACSTLKLGVMLDIKVQGDRLSRSFLNRVAGVLADYGLLRSTMTISQEPLVEEVLGDRIMLKVREDECRKAMKGVAVSLEGRFWFDVPERLPSYMVDTLKGCGALLLPALNTFRYPPHAHEELARQDVRRLLKAGVDGFQIDSVYEELFTANSAK